MTKEDLKFDETAVRNGGKLYYDKKSKTIKAEPSWKDKHIAELEARIRELEKQLATLKPKWKIPHRGIHDTKCYLLEYLKNYLMKDVPLDQIEEEINRALYHEWAQPIEPPEEE